MTVRIGRLYYINCEAFITITEGSDAIIKTA